MDEMKIRNLKGVLSFSGGLDSATVLTYMVEKYGGEILPVYFTYGSSQNQRELECSQKLCQHYGVKLLQVDISSMFSCYSSSLLEKKESSHLGDWKSMFVPARNMVFISLLAGIAESKGAEVIGLGLHCGGRKERSIYPDCRPNFYYCIREAVALVSERKIELAAPFLNSSKTEILEWGMAHGTPYHLTRSCYGGQSLSCGKCIACEARLKAFEALKIKDPINYEN